jgi:glycosyltransferase involved in cell wall biosynthesis
VVDTVVIVPCYDEAARLASDAFARFCGATPWVSFAFVNDGSRDDTLQVLRALAARFPDRVHVIDQQPNQGKAAAVRAGMLWALERNVRFAGYWDADLATPLEEIPGFRRALGEDPQIEMAMGARIQMLGREISRNPWRHYLGRVFATAASTTLGLAVYDTQCGSKLFRVSALTRVLFEEPFVTGWIFDVEILARLVRACRATGRDPSRLVLEVPLRRWRDVAGSRVRPLDFVKAIAELERVRRTYLRDRGPARETGLGG